MSNSSVPFQLRQLFDDWQEVINATHTKSIPVATLLSRTRPTEVHQNYIVVTMTDGTEFHRKQLIENTNLVREALYEVTGHHLGLRFYLEETSSSPARQARRLNKLDREKRRPEIIARWNRRLVMRAYDQATKQDWTFQVSDLIYWSQWATVEEMVASALTVEQLAEFLAFTIRVIQLKEMPYQEYLQTDEWQQLAAACKKRWDDLCTLDATHSADHAHHRTYERRGREYPSDLIPLCSACHSKFHNKKT